VIGSVVDGKYRIKKLLGQGGMGSVYEAEHTTTGRRCAVKLINAAELVRDAQVLSRFEREARAAGAIDTQYITQVLDAGIDRQSGLPFLAMEYMLGEDLQTFLRRVGPIAADLALRIMAQACLGLAKAHEVNVVHRDMKPHNLFLARRDAGEVVIKLLDFGIAKVKMDAAQTAEGADLTRTGNLLGSPLYVSPEQARGKRTIDHRTDIYSLGAVMYQMLCGRTPYEHASALGELILMVCTEPAAPVQDHAPWIQPEVAGIVHRCLEKNPDLRFQTAQQLFEAVHAHLPYGWTIHQDMLVSLADSQRREQAPRLLLRSQPPPPLGESGDRPIGTTLPPGAMRGVSTMPGQSVSMTGGAAVVTSDVGSTTGPVTQQPRAPSSSKLPVLLGAVVVAALAGVGVWAVTRDPGTGRADPVPTTLAAPPPPSASETAVASAPPPKVETLRVKVTIVPDDAQVEVEGQPAELKNHQVELSGELGQVFKVRAFKGTSETEAEIVVSREGAVPSLVEVKVGQKLRIPLGGGPATPASATSGGGKAPPPPPGIQDNTDEFGK
jgi:eukaryotic-like serine/threonine-protein kinase